MYHAYLVRTKMHVRYIIITLLDNGLERKKGQVMQDEAKGILKLDFLANFLKLFGKRDMTYYRVAKLQHLIF
jgi:hypothetical protein